MTSYAVRPNLDDIVEAVSLFEFVGGNTTDAVRIAINKTVSPAKTKIAKKITDRVNLKAAYVKGKISFTKARRAKLEGRVSIKPEGILLSHYEYDAKTVLIGGLVTPNTPIRVKVLKGKGQIKTVTGDKDTYGKPFLFKLKGGGSDGLNYGIGGWRKVPGKGGGRIKAFLAPSPSQEFDDARDKALPEITGLYQAELLDAMRFILRKKHPIE